MESRKLVINYIFVYFACCFSLNTYNDFTIDFKVTKYFNEYVNDCSKEIIVTLDKSVSEIGNKHLNDIFQDINSEDIEELTNLRSDYCNKDNFNQIFKINLNKSCYITNNIISDLNKNNGVLSIEFNEDDISALDSNDIFYLNDNLWGLNGEYGSKINEAWNYNTGSKSVRIGIIDSGIYKHYDLNDNLTDGYDFYNNNSITNDDETGHGTHVAGIIGAVGNNGLGVCGVNWSVSLVPLQTLNSYGKHSVSDNIKAINYASNLWGSENQIDILNYSISGYGLRSSIKAAIENFPGLFVWSAGNNSTNIDNYIECDGSYNLPNLISVGSIDKDGNKCASSNYSLNGKNLDIYAPGASILSTISNDLLGKKTGTSMAAAFVSGVAGLLKSENPFLTGSDLKNAIINYATDKKMSIISEDNIVNDINVKVLNAYESIKNVHIHNYNVKYSQYNNFYHYSYCKCGASIKEVHSFYSSIIDKKVCSLCSFEPTGGLIINEEVLGEELVWFMEKNY